MASKALVRKHPLLISSGKKPRKGKVFSCLTCSKEFYLGPFRSTRGSGKKYCSRECASVSFVKNKLQFNCGVCGEDIHRPICYTKLRGEPKYCSNICRYKVSKKPPDHGDIAIKNSTTRASAKRRLDRIFSRYIRLRDTQDGYGKCCSCSKIITYEEGDAGHFINRRWLATRWREDNVFLQCRPCNRFDEGNMAGYGIFMLNKFGQSHLEYLLALKSENVRYTQYDMELMISEYKKKVKELERL